MFDAKWFLDTYVRIKRKKSGNELFDLNEDQRNAIIHNEGPLWILAGPGTGKTEVLTLKCLRYMIVDEIPPKSIIITTFTKKAATQLIEKVTRYMSWFREDCGAEPLKKIVESELRIGTLHSLCEDIMTSNRYEKFSNFRVVTEIQQRIMLSDNSSYVDIDNVPEEHKDHFISFWDSVHFMSEWRPPYKWSLHAAPSQRCCTKKLALLINRATESNRSVEDLRGLQKERGGTFYGFLADAMEEYYKMMDETFLCDQSYIQKKFLDFLYSSYGLIFLRGDGSDINPPIKRLLVDEYQDTNTIQEEIYFKIAEEIGWHISVVGDDDQALYRFRGGTVELMTTFGPRIESKSNGVSVRRVQLRENYRSHKQIVEWINFQISTRREMQIEGARAPGKQDLIPQSGIDEDYAAVGRITRIKGRGETVEIVRKVLAQKVAELIHGLLEEGVVSDPSQICVLGQSTRAEYNPFAGYLQEELSHINIETYNPTSKDYHQTPIIKELLGMLFLVFDGDKSRATNEILPQYGYNETIRYVNDCKKLARDLMDLPGNEKLRVYIDQSKEVIFDICSDEDDRRIFFKTEKGVVSKEQPTLRMVLYNILNYSPFIDHIDQGNKEARALKTIIELIDSYATLPDKDGISLGDSLKRDKGKRDCIDWFRVNRLYTMVFDIICNDGLDEPDDEEVVVPAGNVPILTIHASKGLEFPIVIVYNYSANLPAPRDEHYLEELFSITKVPSSKEDRALQDAIRKYYVAYSRAQYALIMVSEDDRGVKPPQAWGLKVPNRTFYVGELGKKDGRLIF